MPLPLCVYIPTCSNAARRAKARLYSLVGLSVCSHWRSSVARAWMLCICRSQQAACGAPREPWASSRAWQATAAASNRRLQWRVGGYGAGVGG